MPVLTTELQQAYANAIQVLFGGVVQANPGDVTQTVVEYVDTMMKEISSCSQSITQFSFGLIYDATVGAAVGYVITKLRDDLAAEVGAELVNNQLSGILSDWVTALTGNNQFVGCLYQARANWRSAITIELMGI
ncbi:hypothetical protein [Acinetobacter guerrae]|uniref:hypothetical protein n=1 Tax=Acinetobacter guerrae TaxID=1843371 RepID=UPI00128DA003|nr:hypothetical protein [Acinetobacter guerrae]MPW44753.1 hypothetical protein [Acinetobacter guerrae]